MTHAQHARLIAQHTKVVEGGATANAIGYSLKR